MPIQFPDMMPVPSAEEHRPFLSQFAKALKLGLGFPRELQQADLANALKNVELQYAPQMAQAELGLKGAQTREAGALAGLHELETQFYPESIRSELELRGAQAKEAKERSEKEKAETEQARLITENLRQGLKQQNQEINQATQKGWGDYGVTMPKPTADDIINKKIYGIDSYSPRMQAAQQQQNAQAKMYVDAVQSVNKATQDATDFSNQLASYNYWMDQAFFSGPTLGLTPSYLTGGAAATVDNIINQMSLGAIEQVRDKMASARFAVADLNVALGMKPQRTWDVGTRKFYTDFSNAARDRMNEMSRFYNVASTLKIPKEYADALWTNYQNQYPIANKTGNAVIKRSGNEWQQFLTPEAYNEITTKGSFNPIKQQHITEDNIKDTIKKTKLPRKEVIKLLKSKGYDVSKVEGK